MEALAWSRSKDHSMADGYGRNVTYTAEAAGQTFTAVPDAGSAWVLTHYTDGRAIGAWQYATLRECKEHARQSVALLVAEREAEATALEAWIDTELAVQARKESK